MKIGVMGQSGKTDKRIRELAFRVGVEIARQGCVLITGATTGLPLEAARGAKSKKGLVIGISPAYSERQHVHEFRMPLDNHDAIIYTGFGWKGRNVINIRTSDAVVVINGSVGTLNEFTIAFAEGRPVGVLEGSGGIADKIKDIVRSFDDRFNTPIFYDSDPERLVKLLITHLKGGGR